MRALRGIARSNARLRHWVPYWQVSTPGEGGKEARRKSTINVVPSAVN